MQKKLLSIAAILGASNIATPAFADFTISLGVQSVTQQVTTQTKGMVNDPGTGTAQDYDVTDTDNNTNVGGELAFGYQVDFTREYNLGIEVFGQLAATEVRVPALAGEELLGGFVPLEDGEASFDWLAGLRLRPGYNFTPKMRVFLDGGIVWGDFIVEYEDDVATQLQTEHHTDDTLFGWRYGLGVEHKITPNFTIGADYIITEFNELTKTVSLISPEGSITPGGKNHYVPMLQTLGLNFKYMFGQQEQRPTPPPAMRTYQMRDK